jgi:hypothetical protein
MVKIVNKLLFDQKMEKKTGKIVYFRIKFDFLESPLHLEIFISLIFPDENMKGFAFPQNLIILKNHSTNALFLGVGRRLI